MNLKPKMNFFSIDSDELLIRSGSSETSIIFQSISLLVIAFIFAFILNSLMGFYAWLLVGIVAIFIGVVAIKKSINVEEVSVSLKSQALTIKPFFGEKEIHSFNKLNGMEVLVNETIIKNIKNLLLVIQLGDRKFNLAQTSASKFHAENDVNVISVEFVQALIECLVAKSATSVERACALLIEQSPDYRLVFYENPKDEKIGKLKVGLSRGLIYLLVTPFFLFGLFMIFGVTLKLIGII